jgi:DNA (cytosine-5)-methyltransferase 1
LSNVLEKLPPSSPEWWPRERADYLLAQMSPKHRALAQAMIEGKTTTFGTVFRRVRNGTSMAELRTDGIAGCLRTPKGGSGRQILFAAGKGRFTVRLLNGRECARLMGADDFHLSASTPLNKVLFGFGDAVCVPVVTWIAENHLNPLWDEIHNQYGKPSPYSKAIQYAS